MTEEQIEQKAEEYSEAFENKGVAKASFIKGVKFGLKQHSHDYLVKTINLKKKYEKQIEKMKNCFNCARLEKPDNEGICFKCRMQNKHEAWELEE